MRLGDRSLLLGPPALFLAVLFLLPLYTMLTRAWDPDALSWLASPFVVAGLRTALLQATLSTLLVLVLALPLAWFHHRRRVPWGRLHLAIHAAPFVLPVFVVVYGIRGIFAKGGWIHAATGWDALAAIGPLGAVVLAHAYYNYGFAARLIHAALERRPHALEEAARTLGAPPAHTAILTLRLLAPALGATALLVFLFCFTSFGVVLYLGGDGTVRTLETMLYQNLGGGFPRHDRAAALAALQLTLNVLLLAGYALLLRRQYRFPRRGHAPPPAAPATQIASWTLVALALAPAATVLIGGFRLDGRWTLAVWRAILGGDGIFSRLDVSHALGLSIGYALSSMMISLALTILLAYGLRGMRPWARRIAEMVAALPIGTSSLLIGLGYLFTFGTAFFTPRTVTVWGFWELPGTYLGRALIVCAHALVAFPFTARALLPALAQHDPRIDEAARTLGASPRQVAWRIHAPMLRPAIVAAAGLALAMSLGDFGATLLLTNNQNAPLSAWIHRVDGGALAYQEIHRSAATALSGLLMLLAALAYLAVEWRPRIWRHP